MPKADEAVIWYKKKRLMYQALSKKVEIIVEEILKLNAINFQSVSSRTKTVGSYRKKARRGKYANPRLEIMDMSGIRVITYTDLEARKAAGIIKNAFRIYPQHSVDKSEERGTDRLGYRGIHFVADLGDERLKLPENCVFSDYVFEIQVRSILQHAWAEFEHDRNYKFAGVLPKQITRRLLIAAGNLESIDREFDELSKEIDTYAKDVSQRTLKGDLTVPIDTTSIKSYFGEKFRLLVEKGILELRINSNKDLMRPLSRMGINTLEKLDKIIPSDFCERAKTHYLASLRRTGENQSIDGLLTDILIISNPEAYFKAWGDGWASVERESVELLCSYGVDFEKFIEKYDLEVF